MLYKTLPLLGSHTVTPRFYIYAYDDDAKLTTITLHIAQSTPTSVGADCCGLDGVLPLFARVGTTRRYRYAAYNSHRFYPGNHRFYYGRCDPCTLATSYRSQSFAERPHIARGCKTNLLYWGVALPMTPNIGAEVRLTHHFSVACEVGLNPFKHQNKDGSYGRSFRHLRVLPEVRYWFCESFYRHFVGLHVPFVCYNFQTYMP